MDTTDAQCKLSYSFENKFGNYGLVETRLDC